MKFLFSFLIISATAQAGVIQVQYMNNDLEGATIVSTRLKTKHSIPNKLIRVIPVVKCRILDKRFLELCINEKGELIKLSPANQISITNSFKVFKKRLKNEN